MVTRLLAVVLVPALVLAAVWNWADDRSSARPVTTVPVGASLGPDAEVVSLTAALSWRRVADAVVEAEIADRRRSALDEISLLAVDDTCVVVDDGVGVTVANDRPVALGAAQAAVVAAAAVVLLGPDHRPATTIIGSAPVEGVITGDLTLVGGGDALLGTTSVSGEPRLDPLPTTPLESLAGSLRSAGVVTIAGDVVGVSDRYSDIERPESWNVPLSAAARVGALVVDRGRIRSGPENFALDPAQGAARSLAELLREQGISVEGSARTASSAPSTDDGVEVLAVVLGAPLGEVIGGWLVGSDAPIVAEGWAEFTDALLMEIGLVVAGSGTRAGGAAAIAALVDGLSRADGPPIVGAELAVDLRDGPGLDPESLATCGTLAWAMTVLENLDTDGGVIGLAPPPVGGRVARVKDLSGGPRTRIVVAGERDVVDEIIERARRLQSDGGADPGVPSVGDISPHLLRNPS